MNLRGFFVQNLHSMQWCYLPSQVTGGIGSKCVYYSDLFTFSVFVASLPSVFATFMYGSMSDATGRKPVLLLAMCGTFIHYLIVSLTVTLSM